MNILSDLEAFINEFNTSNNIDFCTDTIRVEFNKQFKLKKLEEVGKWSKVEKEFCFTLKVEKKTARKRNYFCMEIRE